MCVFSSLLFTDDVSLENLLSTGKLQVILVDHNKLAKQQQILKSAVIGIIDHHVDEKQYQETTAGNRIIEMVGSW